MSQYDNKTPVLFGDIAEADVQELRDIAQYFAERDKNETAEFLRSVATRYEVLHGAYMTAFRRECHKVEAPSDAV